MPSVWPILCVCGVGLFVCFLGVNCCPILILYIVLHVYWRSIMRLFGLCTSAVEPSFCYTWLVEGENQQLLFETIVLHQIETVVNSCQCWTSCCNMLLPLLHYHTVTLQCLEAYQKWLKEFWKANSIMFLTLLQNISTNRQHPSSQILYPSPSSFTSIPAELPFHPCSIPAIAAICRIWP